MTKILLILDLVEMSITILIAYLLLPNYAMLAWGLLMGYAYCAIWERIRLYCKFRFVCPRS